MTNRDIATINTRNVSNKTPIRPGCTVWIRRAKCYATVLDMSYDDDWFYVQKEHAHPAEIKMAYCLNELDIPKCLPAPGNFVMLKGDSAHFARDYGVGFVTHCNRGGCFTPDSSTACVVWGPHEPGYRGIEINLNELLMVSTEVGEALSPRSYLNLAGIPRKVSLVDAKAGVKAINDKHDKFTPYGRDAKTNELVVEDLQLMPMKKQSSDVYKTQNLEALERVLEKGSEKKDKVMVPKPQPTIESMVSDIQKRQVDITNEINDIDKRRNDLNIERAQLSKKSLKLLNLMKAIEDLKDDYKFVIEPPGSTASALRADNRSPAAISKVEF